MKQLYLLLFGFLLPATPGMLWAQSLPLAFEFSSAQTGYIDMSFMVDAESGSVPYAVYNASGSTIAQGTAYSSVSSIHLSRIYNAGDTIRVHLGKLTSIHSSQSAVPINYLKIFDPNSSLQQLYLQDTGHA